MTLTEEKCRLVEIAKTYVDVFGTACGDAATQSEHIRRTYRSFARLLHPESSDETRLDEARYKEAFGQLVVFREEADEAVKNGHYGVPLYTATITTRKAAHNIITGGPRGDIAVTYVADTTIGNDTRPSLCKVARRAGDNDLLKTEARALRRVRSEDANPKWTPFMPELLDTFQTSNGARKAGNAIAMLEGFFTLSQVKQAMPKPFDPLHAVWIWRRLLVALGHAHDNGVVHGAVLPDHVMIKPDQHGLVLVDWCYASIKPDDGEYPRLTAIVSKHRDWYPAEVLNKQSPSPATDISLAVRTMIDLMNGDAINGNLLQSVPRQLRAFYKGCLSQSPAARPQNAWLLLQEFDELLETMGVPYYPRHFRPLRLPNRHV